MKVLEGFRQRAGEAASSDELRELFSEAIKTLGYGGFDAFSIKPGTVDNKDVPINLFVCDYEASMVLDYMREGWLHSDPVVAEIAKTTTPFEYLEFLRNVKGNKSAKVQLGLARINGVRRAWIIPLSVVDAVRGVTIYMEGKGTAAEKLFAQTGYEVQLLSMVFMDTYVKLNNLPNVEDDPVQKPETSPAAITKREKECLHWAARGKTNWEIGQILKISENTVRYHMKKSFKRLGANSRARAINRALRLGVIEI